MSHDKFEDWCDSGENYRRELTHVVMRDLSCPDNCDMTGEYRSEIGGSFPLHVHAPAKQLSLSGMQPWSN